MISKLKIKTLKLSTLKIHISRYKYIQGSLVSFPVHLNEHSSTISLRMINENQQKSIIFDTISEFKIKTLKSSILKITYFDITYLGFPSIAISMIQRKSIKIDITIYDTISKLKIKTLKLSTLKIHISPYKHIQGSLVPLNRFIQNQ